MSRGLKFLIIICAVAAVMVIGVVVLSKNSASEGAYESERETSISQTDSVSISKSTDEAVGPTFETPTVELKRTKENTATVTKTATETPEPTETAAPKATAVPIPETPVSNSDKAQINSSTSMNGYIYCSYKSDNKVKIMMNNGALQEVYDLIPDGQYHRFTLHLGDGDYRVRLVENTSGNSYRVVEKQLIFHVKLLIRISPTLCQTHS